MRVKNMFTLGDSNAEESFTGTSLAKEASPSPVPVGDNPNDFFVGQIENVSEATAQIEFEGYGGLKQRFRLRPNEAAICQGCQMKFLRVFVNGTVKLRGVGTVIEAENQIEINQLLSNATTIELGTSGASLFAFPIYDHTDIAATTTTTIATPASGLSIRVYKITISVQGANRIEIRWTDDDGTSNPNTIGIINFTGEGSFVYDFGDNGIVIPNGVDGLLRAITSSAVVTDIDVISEDV